MLASGLFGNPAGIISSDVALDASDPVVGSFTVDGLTYAVGTDGVTLVAVDSAATSDGAIGVPATVAYGGATYPVTTIGPYAFYLSGATDVALPASIASVDDRAFRSSDVARVEVAADNPNIASYDGALYSADLSSLLLIPEGRAGSVPIQSEAEVVEASKFSHCSLVDAISVDGDGAAYLPWEGCLYSADGTTLLRVPAGATEVTIRDGCTTIAAGAMEGCANLERINAAASVTSISPDVFTSIPTVSLPAASVSGSSQQVTDSQDADDSRVAPMLASGQADDPTGAEGEAEVSPRRVVASSQGLEAPLALPDLGSTSASPSSDASGFAPQLTAMVALSATDDDLPEADPASIEVGLPEGVDEAPWQHLSFAIAADRVAPSQAASYSSIASSSAYDAAPVYTVRVYPNGHTMGVREAYWNRVAQNLHSIVRDYLIGPGSNPAYLQSAQVTSWTPNIGSVNVDEGNNAWGGNANITFFYTVTGMEPGWVMRGVSYDPSGSSILGQDKLEQIMTSATLYCIWRPASYTVKLDAQGGTVSPASIAATYDQDLTLPVPAERPGYRFLGWNTATDGSGAMYQAGTVRNLTTVDGATVTLYAQWSYSLGFDTSSEPGDEDYPGDAMDDKPIASDEGQVEIEDPKRPGYVFEGWVIPTEDGTEAVNQELVYQGDDGKWYVDASKLPDYAGDDGRVELTARWTSVISVDVPSSVTFYADLVTQGQESREGAASGGKSNGAFGQNKLSNQSQVDLRVVGLESSAVKTEGSTLGADSILKKADAATPSTSTQKLLSLYPSTKQWTAEELQDPDAVGGTKATTAVDFDLDDILLEKSFKADDFTIAAGGTLNMGYRLNLSETGQQLDYDKLATLSEGQSASIANVSYTFAGDAPLGPTPSGDETDPLYVTVDQAFITANGLDGKAQPGTYGLADIKAAARDLSNHGDDPTQSVYYALYKVLLDKQLMGGGTPVDLSAPYFQLQVDGRYLPVQLIGICQDTKSDGTGNAGLTFQMRDIYAYGNTRSTAAGGGAFNTYMNASNTNSGGWSSAAMRTQLRSTFWSYLPVSMQSAIVGVDKYQQLPSGTTDAYLQKTTGETVWLPSAHEVFGMSFVNFNESEALTSVSGYAPFQYMAYQGNAGSITNTKAVKVYNKSVTHWFLRSARRPYTYNFCIVYTNGNCDASNAPSPQGVAPCFCL